MSEKIDCKGVEAQRHTTTTEALGTIEMVPRAEDVLSTYIIMDYFTRDGRRDRRLVSTRMNRTGMKAVAINFLGHAEQ